jgi:hypothetical protein
LKQLKSWRRKLAELKNTVIDDTGFLRLPSGTTAQRPGSPVAGMMRYNNETNRLEIYDGSEWKLYFNYPYYLINGLSGKFFNGSWRSTISTGNIGTLPLTTTNDSSNVTGTAGLPSADHRYGVNLWPSIAYGNGIGDNYGFIAIGYFKPPSTGTYTVWTASDDGSGVWIGDIASAASGRTTTNATLNNNMGGGQGVTKRSGTISLTAGIYYPIRIVHEETAGGDALTFSWAGPDISETTDLTNHFFTPYSSSTNTHVGNYIDSDMNSNQVENYG